MQNFDIEKNKEIAYKFILKDFEEFNRARRERKQKMKKHSTDKKHGLILGDHQGINGKFKRGNKYYYLRGSTQR